MFRVKNFIVAVACMLPIGAAASSLGPTDLSNEIYKDGVWNEFRFDADDRDGIWLDTVADPEAGVLGSLSFHFTVAEMEKATLQVTDAFRWGDVFSIHANGVYLGDTSAASDADYDAHTEDDYFNDWDATFAHLGWSSGAWHFGEGHYVITGYVSDQPELKGRGALRLIDFTGEPDDPVFTPGGPDSPASVPLPGSLSLMLAGGAAAAVVSRRRARRKDVV